MFGEKFHLEFGDSLGDGIINFNSDALNFFQYKKMLNYNSIKLNCKDSTFTVKMSMTEVIYEDEDESSSEIYSFFSEDENDGKWQYDSISGIISFKLIDSTIWHHFRIEIKGKKDDNPYITWAGNGDYRYLIRLIAIKE